MDISENNFWSVLSVRNYVLKVKLRYSNQCKLPQKEQCSGCDPTRAE